MIVQDLSAADLDSRLRQSGLQLRTGPVVTSIRSSLQAVQRGIAFHYSRYTVEPDQGFADFHLGVDPAGGIWRRLSNQVVFDFDGLRPFAPVRGDLSFSLLEFALNWCVASHCHQFLIVRAAVVERGGQALILPAPAGSGKSTLCSGLVFGGGWRLLSDALALIDPASSCVVPLPRPICLKDDSIDVLRGFAPSALFGDAVHETVKGRVAHVQPPADSVRLAGQSAVPAWIVLPRYVADAAAALAPLSRARAFITLVDNSFNYSVLGRAGFATIADVIDRCDCHQFTYSSLAEAVALLDQLARDAM